MSLRRIPGEEGRATDVHPRPAHPQTDAQRQEALQRRYRLAWAIRVHPWTDATLDAVEALLLEAMR